MRPCIVCGEPTKSARCPRHQRAKPGRSYAERQRRRRVVAAHIATFGNICPGYNREPHEAGDLTADHLLPRVAHGDDGPLAVLCRGCNARKGMGGAEQIERFERASPPLAPPTRESSFVPFL
jgi:5-methylcytosine-specific restriction protein A